MQGAGAGGHGQRAKRSVGGGRVERDGRHEAEMRDEGQGNSERVTGAVSKGASEIGWMGHVRRQRGAKERREYIWSIDMFGRYPTPEGETPRFVVQRQRPTPNGRAGLDWILKRETYGKQRRGRGGRDEMGLGGSYEAILDRKGRVIGAGQGRGGGRMNREGCKRACASWTGFKERRGKER